MKETIDPKSAEQIAALGTKYDEAASNNDTAAVAALFTEDAVFVTDTGPVYGRQAIERWHVDNLQELHHSNHRVEVDQDSLTL